MKTDPRADGLRPDEERTGRRRDLAAVAGAAALLLAAVLVGRALEHADGSLHVGWPPLYAWWEPHLGPGTPAALAVAAAVIAYGPGLAVRLPWRALVFGAWAASLAWILSLALVDGWYRGIARRLTTRYEYLQVIDRFDDVGATLRDFNQHILINSPDHWPAHIAGHPPGAVLTFVGLDRIGLGGGGWAGMWCVVLGGSAAAAVLVTLRALTGERIARAAAPFLVLAPAAVWIGASADGYFTAVAAWSIALLALATTRRARWPAAAAFGSGLLFGLLCYLSYGLTLFAVMAAGVMLVTRTSRPLPLLLAGALVVPIAFTVTGFNWWEAYHLLVERYYQGAAAVRPYAYWIWANLACTVAVIGFATVAGLRRAVGAGREAVRELAPGTGQEAVRGLASCTAPPSPSSRLVLLTLTALLTVAIADLSGMSKAETERIWLPFALWLLPGTALLPRSTHRPWLTAQAILALLINHLLFTGW
ncbi:hypothetical protein ACH429_09265 [Streptomyces pathocidini]|uniref:Integral membrane protein n=1 Tax=Streptomyces pathocidini TaxID=1650571 RepID=A0ABW7URG3_9ACTN|nr:hypothetical protein [Streptomyces pathocidini]